MVDEFLLQPFVYNTNGKNTLLSLLEEHWIERLQLGRGTIYIDLKIVDKETRVTFEAGNNVDFRLGTGPLRYTKVAQEEDIAAITRRANAVYELKIIKKDTDKYVQLQSFMINFIGHRGKKYGYIPNENFDKIMGRASTLHRSS